MPRALERRDRLVPEVDLPTLPALRRRDHASRDGSSHRRSGPSRDRRLPPPQREQLPQPQPRLEADQDHRPPLLIRTLDQSLRLAEVEKIELRFRRLQPLDFWHSFNQPPLLGDDQQPPEDGQVVVDRLLREPLLSLARDIVLNVRVSDPIRDVRPKAGVRWRRRIISFVSISDGLFFVALTSRNVPANASNFCGASFGWALGFRIASSSRLMCSLSARSAASLVLRVGVPWIRVLVPSGRRICTAVSPALRPLVPLVYVRAHDGRPFHLRRAGLHGSTVASAGGTSGRSGGSPRSRPRMAVLAIRITRRGPSRAAGSSPRSMSCRSSLTPIRSAAAASRDVRTSGRFPFCATTGPPLEDRPPWEAVDPVCAPSA